MSISRAPTLKKINENPRINAFWIDRNSIDTHRGCHSLLRCHVWRARGKPGLLACIDIEGMHEMTRSDMRHALAAAIEEVLKNGQD